MKKIIYLDLDDTLADTSKVLGELLKHPNFNINSFLLKDVSYWFKYLKLMSNVYKDHDFWRNLPLKKDAINIYNHSKKITTDVKILSALPIYYKKEKPAFLSASKAKSDWVNNHFSEINNEDIIISYSKYKHYHVKQDGNLHILIDDKISNIKSWHRMGGLAIHCINSENVIEQLKFIGSYNGSNDYLLKDFNSLYSGDLK